VEFRTFTRTVTALVAGATFFAIASVCADATDTFNVSTTITAACSLADGDGGPADLTPSYTPSTDSGTGTETVLDTSCTGSVPTVTFTDTYNSGTTVFEMTSGSSQLFYQLSSDPSCDGTPGDLPITEGVAQNLLQGFGSYEICAAVIAGGGMNVNAAAGSYSDTVTYTITP
jgi:hypothetical protein